MLLAGQRLQPNKRDALATLAPNAGLQKLVAPVSLPDRRPRPSHRVVRRRRLPLGHFVERERGGGRDRLDRERTRDARLGSVRVGLVVEDNFGRRLIVCERPCRYLGDALVPETAPDSLIGTRQVVVVEVRRHEALPSQGGCYARGIACDPAPPPLLSDVCGGSAAAGRIEDEIAWVSGHQDAALYHLDGRFDHIALAGGRHRRGPDVVDPPPRNLVLVLLPHQRGLPLERLQPAQLGEPVHTLLGDPPMAGLAAMEDASVVLVGL